MDDRDEGKRSPVAGPPHVTWRLHGMRGNWLEGQRRDQWNPLVSVSLRQVRAVPYRFCAEADCSVVYFSEDGTQTFTKANVRERVYQKERDLMMS